MKIKLLYIPLKVTILISLFLCSGRDGEEDADTSWYKDERRTECRADGYLPHEEGQRRKV
jgi:hypothetical protein